MSEVEVIVEEGGVKEQKLSREPLSNEELEEIRGIEKPVDYNEIKQDSQETGMLKFAREGLRDVLAKEKQIQEKAEKEKVHLPEIDKIEEEKEQIVDQTHEKIEEIKDEQSLTEMQKEPAQETQKEQTAQKPILKVGQYELIEEIGKGGFGTVYLAKTRSNAKIAVKVMENNKDKLPDLEEKIKQFNEIIHNPNVVTVIDADLKNNPAFLVMEYGGKALDTKKERSMEEKIRKIIDLGEIIEYLHSKKIIHRDIKPGNILEDEDGNIRITDLELAQLKVEKDGLAHSLQKSLRDGDPGKLIGTIAYMAPEQKEPNAKEIDERADIYAFGVVAYELLTGKRPGTSAEKELQKTKMPEKIKQIVMKTIEEDLKERYQTMKEIMDDLEYVWGEEDFSEYDAQKDGEEEKESEEYKGFFGKDIISYSKTEDGRTIAYDWKPEHVLIKTAQYYEEINKILTEKGHKNLKLKNAEIKLVHPNAVKKEEKTTKDIATLEELIKLNYEIEESSFLFESEQTKLEVKYYFDKEIGWIGDKEYKYSGKKLDIKIKLKEEPEKNAQLYSELKKYLEENTNSQPQMNSHMDALAKKGHNYENTLSSLKKLEEEKKKSEEKVEEKKEAERKEEVKQENKKEEPKIEEKKKTEDEYKGQFYKEFGMFNNPGKDKCFYKMSSKYLMIKTASITSTINRILMSHNYHILNLKKIEAKTTHDKSIPKEKQANNAQTLEKLINAEYQVSEAEIILESDKTKLILKYNEADNFWFKGEPEKKYTGGKLGVNLLLKDAPEDNTKAYSEIENHFKTIDWITFDKATEDIKQLEKEGYTYEHSINVFKKMEEENQTKDPLTKPAMKEEVKTETAKIEEEQLEKKISDNVSYYEDPGLAMKKLAVKNGHWIGVGNESHVIHDYAKIYGWIPTQEIGGSKNDEFFIYNKKKITVEKEIIKGFFRKRKEIIKEEEEKYIQLAYVKFNSITDWQVQINKKEAVKEITQLVTELARHYTNAKAAITLVGQ